MLMANNQIGLRVHNLSASYSSRKKKAVPVLKGASLEAMRGTITVVVGSSGAGKSTLINCVAGLQPIEDGEISFTVDGGARQIVCDRGRGLSTAERRFIGVCFQQSHLWSHMTVRENLVHPQVWLKKTPRNVAENKANALLAALRLDAQAGSQVTQLSGGQRQRVAILRALAVDPEVLLLDEITASQDPANVQSIFGIVKAYVKESGCTVLTISHDMQFVRKIADVVHLIQGGEVVETCTHKELAIGTVGTRMADFTKAFEEHREELNHPEDSLADPRL